MTESHAGPPASCASRGRPQPLIVRLNLDVVGGAEVCFAQYAAHRQALNAADTVIVGETVHPRFAAAIEPPLRAVSRRGFRLWHGLRLPRAARRLRARNAVRQAVRGNEAALVGWNSIGNRQIVDIARLADLPLVHYEHGQAWRPTVRNARAYLDAAHGVIANSHAAERMLALRWGWHGPTVRVYCAIDAIRPVEAARLAPPRNRALWLGSVGRMVEFKGHRLALYTLKVLRDERGIDARLAIAGTGECEAALHAEAARLGLSHVVRFEGSVADMAAFYDAIDVMLVPSLREPFGRTSIEAQARGCPVIASAVDGLPETLGAGAHARALVVPEWSLAEYSNELGVGADIGVDRVYDPQGDDLMRPRAPTPDQLAGAVAALIETDTTYHHASRIGLQHVGERFKLADYGPAVDHAVSRLSTREC